MMLHFIPQLIRTVDEWIIYITPLDVVWFKGVVPIWSRFAGMTDVALHDYVIILS